VRGKMVKGMPVCPKCKSGFLSQLDDLQLFRGKEVLGYGYI
jgi:hypothetical protein